MFTDQNRHIVKLAAGIIQAVNPTSENQAAYLARVRRILALCPLVKEVINAACTVPFKGINQVSDRVILVLSKDNP
jgi:hypothetical protein